MEEALATRPKKTGKLTAAQQAVLDDQSKSMASIGVGYDGSANRSSIRSLCIRAAATLQMRGVNRWVAKRLCENATAAAPRFPNPSI